MATFIVKYVRRFILTVDCDTPEEAKEIAEVNGEYGQDTGDVEILDIAEITGLNTVDISNYGVLH